MADRFDSAWWLLHNVFAHPVYGVLLLVRAQRPALWVHDMTLPPRVRRQLRAELAAQGGGNG